MRVAENNYFSIPHSIRGITPRKFFSVLFLYSFRWEYRKKRRRYMCRRSMVVFLLNANSNRISAIRRLVFHRNWIGKINVFIIFETRGLDSIHIKPYACYWSLIEYSFYTTLQFLTFYTLFCYRQLGCLAFSLGFWPKIKQFLSNCLASVWTFSFKTACFC